MQKKDGAWRIVQPLDTGADESSIDAITGDLADAQVSQTEPATPDRLKVYGLAPAQLSIEFQTAKGAKHSLDLGNKDFTGSSVYARVDGAAKVDVLPASLLTDAGKSLDDLRDKTVLHLTASDVQSFDLRNRSGEIVASRTKTGWNLTKPAAEAGDEQSINDLLNAVSSAKMVDIASEQPKDLPKYGLAHPAITFSAVEKAGKTSTLLVGAKTGENYYARDASQPMVFSVQGALESKLEAKYASLRDKKVGEITQDDVKGIELHDTSGTIILNRSGDKWTFEEPAGEKGKQAETWKVFSGIMDARATDILDHPSADIEASLAKPKIELILTRNDGTKWTLKLAAAAKEDFVYASASDRKPVYKLPSETMQSLDLKPADMVF